MYSLPKTIRFLSITLIFSGCTMKERCTRMKRLEGSNSSYDYILISERMG